VSACRASEAKIWPARARHAVPRPLLKGSSRHGETAILRRLESGLDRNTSFGCQSKIRTFSEGRIHTAAVPFCSQDRILHDMARLAILIAVFGASLRGRIGCGWWCGGGGGWGGRSVALAACALQIGGWMACCPGCLRRLEVGWPRYSRIRSRCVLPQSAACALPASALHQSPTALTRPAAVAKTAPVAPETLRLRGGGK
jgi:hypothetical protein